jgi:hypothetical protein
MFRKLPDSAPLDATVIVDGVPVRCTAGEPVAALLLRLDGMNARLTETGAARGPHCMIGVCFDCIVIADDGPTRRSCLLPARDGMRITRHPGRRAL